MFSFQAVCPRTSEAMEVMEATMAEIVAYIASLGGYPATALI